MLHVENPEGGDASALIPPHPLSCHGHRQISPAPEKCARATSERNENTSRTNRDIVMDFDGRRRREDGRHHCETPHGGHFCSPVLCYDRLLYSFSEFPSLVYLRQRHPLERKKSLYPLNR
jgi:hypothetical protein